MIILVTSGAVSALCILYWLSEHTLFVFVS